MSRTVIEEYEIEILSLCQPFNCPFTVKNFQNSGILTNQSSCKAIIKIRLNNA